MSRPNRILASLAPAGLTFALAGCAVFVAQHSPTPVPAEPVPPAPVVASAASPAPALTAGGPATFTRVQNEIFGPKCAIPECHVTPPPTADDGPPSGLIFEAGKSYDMIVGVRSKEMDLMRVAPGDPDNSFVLRKVTPGAKIAWHAMPLDKPPLSDAERGLIRQWIAAGAKKD